MASTVLLAAVAAVAAPFSVRICPETKAMLRFGQRFGALRARSRSCGRLQPRAARKKEFETQGQADRFVYASDAPKVAIPTLMYETAGKFDDTGNLTLDAVLDAGFQGICSSNRPIDNEEEQVGAAIAELKKQGFKRSDYFVQTRYFPSGLQAGEMTPYDRGAPLPIQIRQSFIVSQGNLNLNKFDAFVWEGATSYMLVRDRDMEAWSEMENLYLEGRTNLIGISHFELPQIQEIYSRAEVKPMIVGQTHPRTGYTQNMDGIEMFGSGAHSMESSFSFKAHRLLEMNEWVLREDGVVDMADRHGVRPEQILIRFALQSGIALILDLGRSSEMQMATEVYDRVELHEDEMMYLETIDEKYYPPFKI